MYYPINSGKAIDRIINTNFLYSLIELLTDYINMKKTFKIEVKTGFVRLPPRTLASLPVVSYNYYELITASRYTVIFANQSYKGLYINENISVTYV